MSIVKSFSVGDGDMFYIKHVTDNFSVIDCCLPDGDEEYIINELKSESKDKNVVRFISTHPDDDHICGLNYLNQEMQILNFYCVRNEATKHDKSDDFEEYCNLRDDSKKSFYLYRGCSRKWMNLDSDERRNAGIDILWPILDNGHYKEALKLTKEGESPNNISPIVRYRLKDGAKILWMGDLETDFMEKIKNEIPMVPIDILFAPHHGRDKVPEGWLKVMNPKIVIIGEAPSKHLNYYPGYNTITQNTSGDITFECVLGKTHIYVSNAYYHVDFLYNENMRDIYGNYIGTLKV